MTFFLMEDCILLLKRKLPFIILEPQCPIQSEWVFQLDVLIAHIQAMSEEYKVDKSRMYLTGYSYGKNT